MSRPAKRPRQPRMLLEVRREQVLDATLQLVHRSGYAAVTMEAVSREAQLVKPRVYAAYPGVESLLLALFEREGQRALSTLAEAMPSFDADGDFDDVLLTAMTNLLHAVAANPDSWRLLALPADNAPPQVRERAETARQFALTQLQALLEWGRDRRPGLDILDLELTAITLLAAGERAAHLVLTEPERFTPERYRHFARNLLNLLTPPL
ncbi:TetR/AcrR family transcriptional regulator [Nocardia sp. GCM10030253]|uniref:TetR/AcrR family transcriptional regulator n=1 Tax=Nocardia sp. GCM10030253 TaxID=3273404 RepID=UPI0036330BCE